MPGEEVKMSDKEIREFCRRFVCHYDCKGRECDECSYYYLCKGAYDIVYTFSLDDDNYTTF